VILWDVGNRLERLEENGESFAMSRVAAVEHHDRLAVVIDVAVDILSTTHLQYGSRDTNHIAVRYLGSDKHKPWTETAIPMKSFIHKLGLRYSYKFYVIS